MKKFILLVGLMSLGMLGCADMSNQIARDGGILGSYNGDYVIRNDSGGVIMDVWKLKGVKVTETNGQCLFRDNKGNVVTIGGDVKILRVNDSETWDHYHEYHVENDKIPYQVKYGTPE